MKKEFLIVIMILVASLTSITLFAEGTQDTGDSAGKTEMMPGVLSVELIYLNHGPVRKVIADIDNLLEGYGEEIHIIHYTFSSPEGKLYAESKKLDGHIPLAVFIDGSMEFSVDNRSVEFISFPQGQGTGVVPDGGWSIDDLERVIDGILEKS